MLRKMMNVAVMGAAMIVSNPALAQGTAAEAKKHPINVLDRVADSVVALRVFPKALFVDRVSPRTIHAMHGERDVAMHPCIRHRGSGLVIQRWTGELAFFDHPFKAFTNSFDTVLILVAI